MSNIFNSIITTHRDRLGSLRGYLCALSIAAKYVDRDSFEVVITDLGESEKVNATIRGYQKYINIKHLSPNYNGIFWKSKALNHCALNSEGKYLTMIDVDAIVPPYFLKHIEEFYRDKEKYNVKLAHRVKFLDNKFSKVVTKRQFDEEFMVKQLMANDKRFRLAFERFTIEEVKMRGLKGPQKKWYCSQALGNSHFTMRKEDFIAIGGYDESFIGWACEDLDFNRRAFAYLGRGYLRPELPYVIYSVHHSRQAWMNQKTTTRNEKLYARNKKNKVIILPITKTWGIF